uniref:VENN motif pre-toxin domain-containing protein n=1 Tax=Budvicia diplopodorum TaxID=1119056 RepID=UPI001BAD2310
GGGKNGIRVFADANFSQSNMNADGLYWTESTLDAGNKLSIISGRDTSLIGAQAKGDSVLMDVGRDLTVRSLQDTDDYSYESFSLNVSGSYGSGFDMSLGLVMDKMDRTWASVNEQAGIFASKGGYDITVGGHTQLDGAVIASEATADKNNLDTGTLGWSDIKNKAEYDVSHMSISVGTGGGAPMGFPGVPTTPIVVMYGEKASSTTNSAIAAGNITIRDKANQQQDVAALSNDTQNANDVLDKIFDAEKEQNKLTAITLAGEIAQQVTTIATNIGVKAAQDKATEEADAGKEAASKDPAIQAQAREDLAKQNITNPTQEQLNEATYNVVYNAAYQKEYEVQMKKYGTGSDVGRAIQAAGAALSVAMGGGSVGNAAAAASAPYLAHEVKKHTEGKVANAIAHAIVGAAVAQGSGTNALAGATGAASGELIAQIIIKELYEGKKPEELTEAERKTVAALSSIAAGAIGGVAGDSSESVATAAGAGKNAVENNSLSTLVKAGEKALESCVKNATCRSGMNQMGISIGLTNSQIEEAMKAGATRDPAQIANLSPEQIVYLDAQIKSGAGMAGLILGSVTWGDRLNVPTHTGGNQIVESGPTNTGGDQLPGQGPTHTGNNDGQVDTGPNHTGNNTGAPDTGNLPGTPIPEQPSIDDIAYIAGGYEPNKGTIGNMGEFLNQPGFGSDIKESTHKSSQQYQGQSVYKATGNVGEYIKKGDQFYLDGQHKNHLEVFDKRGNFKVVLNLDGTINQTKTDAAVGRKLK